MMTAELRNHCNRTEVLACLLAKAAGLAEEEIRSLAFAAKYHDIGKLMIPEVILDKPGRLTEEERKIVETHAESGYRMLQGYPEGIREIVRYHHENEDGRGYFGLSGEEIPLGAKILHLCDVFDALTSRRSYKVPWPVADALSFLQEQKGKSFDPKLTDLFVYRVIPAYVIPGKKEQSA